MPVPPSFRDIADDLSDRIRAGEYQPGTALPKLTELADLYGVSVSTIQRALGLVKDRGLAVGSPGRAIYVAERRPRR